MRPHADYLIIMMENSALASLNVIPFLGLMNLLEVKYMHIPEVYRTVLAILCDYNPLVPSNVVKTRNYIKVLLSREQDLAQCLLNFIDEPQEKISRLLHRKEEDDSVCSLEKMNRSCPTAEPMSEPQVECRSLSVSTINVSTSSCQSSTTGNLSPAIGGMRPESPDSRYLITANDTNSLHSNMGEDGDTSPTVNHRSSNQATRLQNISDRLHHFAPVINIQHRNIGNNTCTTMDASGASTTPVHPAQMFLPRLLSSSPLLSVSSQRPAEVTHFNTRSCTADGSNKLNEKWSTTKKLESKVFTQLDGVSAGTTDKIVSEKTSASSTMDTGHNDSSVNICQTGLCLPKDVRCNLMFPDQSSSLTALKASASTIAPGIAAPPDICLSKLLGQPSVAYLPSGPYYESDSSFIDSGPKGREMNAYSTPLLDTSKVSSASAKLRLLSTQVGSDRVGSVHGTGLGKSYAAMTATLGSLSVQTTVSEKHRLNVDICAENAAKFRDSTKPLSKILPVPKNDAVYEQKTVKQMQVGERQLCKRPKILVDRREQSCSTSPALLTRVKVNAAGQLQNLDKHEEEGNVASHGTETKFLSATEKRYSSAKCATGEKDMPIEETSARSDCRKWARDGSGNRVQVVEVSFGASTNGLSAFPYIQQMVLPDNQTLEISTNKSQNMSTSEILDLPTCTGSNRKEPCRIISKPFVSGLSAFSSVKTKPTTLTKPTTQIILKKKTAKLSVCIQASGSKRSCKPGYFSSILSTNHVLASTNSFLPKDTQVQPQTESGNNKPHKHLQLSQEENIPSSIKEAIQVQLKGKRKRSTSTCTRPILKNKQ